MTKKSTYQTRVEATAAKKARDVENCHQFIFRVISPMYAGLVAENHGRLNPIKISAREVQDTYGLKAAQCFKLMFRLVHRGGFSKENMAGFASTWVPNVSAIGPYIAWARNVADDSTCGSLLTALQKAEVTELQYHQGSWLPVLMRKAATAHRRKREAEKRASYIEFCKRRSNLALNDLEQSLQ